MALMRLQQAQRRFVRPSLEERVEDSVEDRTGRRHTREEGRTGPKFHVVGVPEQGGRGQPPMLEHGFRHLPVLDDDGQVSGVVSLRRVVGAAQTA